MKNIKLWKILLVAVMYSTVFIPISTVSANDTNDMKQVKQSQPEKYNLTTDKDFIIENGILKKYIGESSKVSISEEVKNINKTAFSDTCLEEVILNGTFNSISGVFNEQKELKIVTVNGRVKKIDNNTFLNCNSLKKFIVNGSIDKLEDDVFHWSPEVTIYGKEYSCILEYAEKYNIPYEIIEANKIDQTLNELPSLDSPVYLLDTYPQKTADKDSIQEGLQKEDYKHQLVKYKSLCKIWEVKNQRRVE